MKAKSRTRIGVRRPCRPLWCIVFFAVAQFGAIGSIKLHGESIVVEQGSQQVRNDAIHIDPGEQIVVRDENSKLDLQSSLVVDGGTVRLESGARLNTASANGDTRLASGGARGIVDGPGSVWTIGGYMEVGDAGEAHLLISDGGRVQSGLAPDNRSRVSGGGDGGAAAATATITGVGSIWSAGSIFAVGDSGEAHLLISEGGRLESGLDGTASRVLGGGGMGEPMSSATVRGVASKWIAGGELEIGGTNGANLTISDGGQVESGLNGRPSRISSGGRPGAPASTVSITGAGSRWIAAGELDIGETGPAQLTVSQGAILESGSNGDHTRVSGAGLPFSAPATATIEGTGSAWIVGGEFAIGDSGETGLLIEGGGRVESGHGGGATRIVGGGAEYGKPPAAVVVSGEGSRWDILGDFDIRRGTLSIVDGGLVTSGRNGDTDMDGPGEVTISGDGSKWEIEGRYQMASRGPVIARIAQGGLLSVSGTIASRPGGVLLLDGGRVEAQEVSADVEIRGSGAIQSDVTSSGETIVGGSTGMLTIGGDFTQTSTASLLLEVAGRGSVAGVDFDQLVVEDIATLSGAIDVSLLDDFRPALGDSFELVRYGSVQFGNAGGMPPELRLPTLDSGLAWRSDFGTQALTVSVQAVPEPTSALLAVVGLLAAWRWGNKRLSSG